MANYTNQPVHPEVAVEFAGVTDTSLTASRLVASNASQELSSTLLTSWLAGTTNRVTVAVDGSGGATLSAPQDIDTTASPTFVVSSVRCVPRTHRTAA